MSINKDDARICITATGKKADAWRSINIARLQAEGIKEETHRERLSLRAECKREECYKSAGRNYEAPRRNRNARRLEKKAYNQDTGSHEQGKAE